MKRLVLACFILTGCMTDAPTAQLDAALQELSVACVGGDDAACERYATLYDARSAQRTSVAQPVAVVQPVARPVYVPQQQPFPQMTGPQQTICQRQFGGPQVVCRSY